MLRIYLTNLGKYNEGALIGEWVELPCDDFSPVFERIGISEEPDENGNYYEEYFITDYESDVPGLRIGEYDNLEELNRLAEIIEDVPEKVEVLKYFGYTESEEIREHLDDVVYVTTPEGFESDEFAVGYYYAKECGCIDIPENVEPYFDFEAYGRDIMIEGSFYKTENGDIYEMIA